MVVVLVILSVGLLGVMIYFAVSPKSSKLLRMAAVIGLGLICLSLLICGFFIVLGPAEEEEVIIPFPITSEAQTAPVKEESHLFDIILIVVIMLALAGIILKAIRDQRKIDEANKKAAKLGKPLILGDTPPLTDSLKSDSSIDTNEDDSFDIGLDLK